MRTAIVCVFDLVVVQPVAGMIVKIFMTTTNSNNDTIIMIIWWNSQSVRWLVAIFGLNA